MATPDGGDSDLQKEKYDIMIYIAIYYEKDVQAVYSERKVLNPDFKKSDNTENFSRNCLVCLQAIS